MRTPSARPLPMRRLAARCTLPLLLAALAVPLPRAAAQGEVSVLVEVRQVRDARGHVLVALCTRQTFLTRSCPYHAAVAAAAGTVTVRIDGVPPGTYGVQAFHDDNDSGTLERTFLGLPAKGMGFSRDAPMRFGPPRFDDAAFRVADAAAIVVLALHYY